MALPTSRNTTYAPTSMVKSVDFNDIQDCIIGGKHGVIEVTLDLGETLNIENFGPNANGQIFSTNTNAAAARSLALKVGTTIAALRAFASDTGLNGTIKLQKAAGAAAPSDVATLSAFSAGGETKSVAISETVTTGVRYRILFQTGAGAGQFTVSNAAYDTKRL